MKIEDIFEIDECVFIEPTLMDHTEDGYTAMAVGMDADLSGLLIDEEEDPIALALRSGDRWYVSSYIFRDPDIALIEKFEECGGDLFQEKRDDYVRAVREYYCRDIVKEFPDVLEDNRPGRDQLVHELLEDVFGCGCKGISTVTDFCCGSGVATSVMEKTGLKTLSFDLDASLISLGIRKERLDPERTMCIDARAASVFCPPCDLCIGLMMGDINNINAGMWECIIDEMLEIGKKSLITVATEPESRRVAGWLEDAGLAVSGYENTRDPIYDRFVLIAE